MVNNNKNWDRLRIIYAAALQASPDPVSEAWYAGPVLDPLSIRCSHVALLRQLWQWVREP